MTKETITIGINAKDKSGRVLKQTKKNLDKTSKAATGLAARFRNVARATVIMEGPLGGTAGRMSAMATMMGNVSLGAIGFGLAITASTAVLVAAGKEYAKFESATLKINQLLERTGGAAGLTADEIEVMSRRIGKDTLSSASDVREASAVLLSFKGIGVDAFERTMVMASDMAAVTGQDLKQSVIQLGKALEDPATNMSTLRRNGVSFTNSQKAVIVAMKESGDAAGAQAAMFDLLEGQMGGAGKAAGGGLAGAADLVAENWSLMLIEFGKSGPGQAATAALNSLGRALEWVSYLLTSDNDLQKQRFQLMDQIKSKTEELTRLAQDKTPNAGKIRQIQLLATERQALIDRKDTLQATAQAEIDAARVRGAAVQEENDKVAASEMAAEAASKKRKEEAKAYEKADAGADKFVDNLLKEEEKFATSLLTKEMQESTHYANRLLKLQEFNELKYLTDEEADAAALVARQLYDQKITEITKTEKDKRDSDTKKRKEMELAATQTALGDIAGMMSGSSKKLFKVGKAAAIANALINTYQAVTKTMASTPYPFNIPLAIAQGAAGMVNVQKIKSQKMAAKEHGGSVIGGRSYLVGEKGPELFTPPRTGQVINNSTTSSLGGATNNINVTVVNDTGEEFIERNAVKIWDSIVDKMNEEGMRFA